MTALLIILGLYLAILGSCLFVLFLREKDNTPDQDWPMISIWVAARNEEKNILSCLQHLDRLDYPKDRIEILVGNDESEDATAAIVSDYIKNKPWFRLIDITANMGKARKKANVLAHLGHESRGEFYLLCDADMEAPPSWAKGLVSAFGKNTGVISATTYIKPASSFASMQGLDWLYFLGLIKAFARFGIPCTAVGNNMAVRREAYEDCGGYENLDFSITEDFKLFKEIIIRGWEWKQLLNEETLSLSGPAPDFRSLMRQRKRWLTGGKELFWYWKLLIVILASFIPAIVILAFLNPLAALSIYFIKILLQTTILLVLLSRTGLGVSLIDILKYEAYSLILSLVTPVFFFLPGGKTWKGRNFIL